MNTAFTDIYEERVWGDNNDIKYAGSSGIGSSLEYNQSRWIPFLKNFILKNGVKSVVDLGCGDFQCGPVIYNSLPIEKYTGYDAYGKVVTANSERNLSSKFSFFHCDISNEVENIEPADLCILKDVLQHWPDEEIVLFMDQLVACKKYKLILLCNCSTGEILENKLVGGFVGGFHPLKAETYPLNKYNPKVVFGWHTKEVCLINMDMKAADSALVFFLFFKIKLVSFTTLTCISFHVCFSFP